MTPERLNEIDHLPNVSIFTVRKLTQAIRNLRSRLADLEAKNNELMALYSKRESPLEKFNEFIEDEKDPVERLRFYLSLALTGQDWLDVESFFNDIIKERKDHEAKKLVADRDDYFMGLFISPIGDRCRKGPEEE